MLAHRNGRSNIRQHIKLLEITMPMRQRLFNYKKTYSLVLNSWVKFHNQTTINVSIWQHDDSVWPLSNSTCARRCAHVNMSKVTLFRIQLISLVGGIPSVNLFVYLSFVGLGLVSKLRWRRRRGRRQLMRYIQMVKMSFEYEFLCMEWKIFSISFSERGITVVLSDSRHINFFWIFFFVDFE